MDPDLSKTMNFDADHPIERRDQDRLERREFAESIADQILSIPAERGFTVAVAGPWGSGKTSVLNMVRETLEAKGDRIVVLQFNPWLFSGAEDLLLRFFSELSAQLRQSKVEAIKRVAKALAELGDAAAPLIPLPWLGLITRVAATIAKKWTKPKSLLSQRDVLDNALAESDSRILVIIDDIDRLERDETREIMRLVRLTSDLPNLIFLLAFDRDHVANSLAEDEAEGRAYLEKIVQQTHDTPSIRQGVLQKVFLEEFEEIVVDRGLVPPEQPVWAPVFFDVINPLLHSLRDVKRLIYSLPVMLDAVSDEVALQDILGLEAIRVLRPQVFEAIRANAAHLVGTRGTLRRDMLRVGAVEESRDAIRKMIEDAKNEAKWLQRVVGILFPSARGVLEGGSGGSASHDSLRAQRRVGNEEVLRIYLQAGLSEGTVPSREVRELVDSLPDEERLESQFESSSDERLQALIERLADFGNEFVEDSVPTAVPVLVNQLGRLSHHAPHMLGVSPRSTARVVILRLLRSVKDTATLESQMDAMLSKINSLSGRYSLLGQVGHREQVERQLISRQQSIEIEEVLKAQLEAATAEQLAAEPDLAEMTTRAMHWLDGEEKARLAAGLREHLASDEFVMNLLRTSVNTAFLNGRLERRLFWKELIEDYGDGFPDAVRRLIHSLDGQERSDEGREAVDLAQRYLDGWRPQE